MLHTKFHGNRFWRRFFKGLNIYRRPRCSEQTFVPPTHGGSSQNLALIGEAVSDKKMFEHCKRMEDGCQSMGIL